LGRSAYLLVSYILLLETFFSPGDCKQRNYKNSSDSCFYKILAPIPLATYFLVRYQSNEVKPPINCLQSKQLFSANVCHLSSTRKARYLMMPRIGVYSGTQQMTSQVRFDIQKKLQYTQMIRLPHSGHTPLFAIHDRVNSAYKVPLQAWRNSLGAEVDFHQRSCQWFGFHSSFLQAESSCPDNLGAFTILKANSQAWGGFDIASLHHLGC
jgi:hypothetical protein